MKSTDVSLGDLPKARSVLNAAVRARHVVSTHPVQFWVTEFSWDSKPPDSHGVPLGLEAQWVSEALFRVWRAGVSMFTWFLLKDDPSEQHAVPVRALLPQREGRSRALTAFRFPFVALRTYAERLRLGPHARGAARDRGDRTEERRRAGNGSRR